jgi:hypothetical protein
MRKTDLEDVPPVPRSARYFLAKYIPDLERMEPRNIGVLIWTPGGATVRFIGQRRDGAVDGRGIPGWIKSQTAYREWVRFWTDSVRDAAETRDANESWRRFWELRQSSKTSYLLGEGGILLDTMEPNQLADLTTHLFSTLVETHESIRPTLESRCKEVLEATHITELPYYQKDASVPIHRGDEKRKMPFHYVLKNGIFQGLFERVPLKNQSVYSSAYKFEQVREAQIVPRERTGAFVYLDEKLYEQDRTQSFLAELLAVTPVLNLSDIMLPRIGNLASTRERLEAVTRELIGT